MHASVGNSCSFSDSADWQLATSNSDPYTVECAIRFNTITTNMNFVCQYTASGNFAWGLQTLASSSEFAFFSSQDGTTVNAVNSSGASLTTGVWYQFAADKDATGKIRIYKNGVMLGSATPANSAIFNSASGLGIGCTPGPGNRLDGWIDELRITKGVARYASDGGYTPAVAAFPRS
jgi:hypothetical protein